RQTYYSVPFAPYGRMDGSVPDPTAAYPGEPNYLTQADVDNEWAKTSPFNIVATQYFFADSVFVNVTITATADYAPANGIIKLRTALCKSLTFVNAPGSNGEKVFENVVRAMYPSSTGKALSGSWTAGMTQSITMTGKVPSEY